MRKRNLVILAIIGLAITAVIGTVVLPAITHSADLPRRIGTSQLGRGTLTNYYAEGWKSSYTSVSSIAVAPDGAVWFVTDSLKGHEGIFRFDGRKWLNYTFCAGGSSSTVASDGALWFGCIGGALCFDGEKWTSYTTRDGDADNSVYAITATFDGVLWFGTRDGVILRFEV